jgi:hypothetical protein
MSAAGVGHDIASSDWIRALAIRSAEWKSQAPIWSSAMNSPGTEHPYLQTSKRAYAVVFMGIIAVIVTATNTLHADDALDENSHVSYEQLTQLYLNREFESVLNATVISGERPEPAIAFRTALLKARAADAGHAKYFREHDLNGRRVSEDDRRHLEFWSQASAKFHEQAYHAAATNHQRLQIMARWFANVNPLKQAFYARSATIEEAFKQLYQQPAAQPDVIRRQAELLGAAAGGVARISPRGVASVVYGNRVAEAFEHEFMAIVRTPVPNDVFDELIADCALYVFFLFPTVSDAQSMQASMPTLRWYLWGAITRVPPEDWERQAIDKQVGEFADDIQATLASITGAGCGEVAAARQFRGAYKLMKSNRFVPYFKRFQCADELARAKATVSGQIKAAKERIDSARRAVARAEDDERHRAEQALADHLDGTHRVMKHFLMFGRYQFDDPVRSGLLPPSYFIQLAQASTIADTYMLRFSVDRLVSMTKEEEKP